MQATFVQAVRVLVTTMLELTVRMTAEVLKVFVKAVRLIAETVRVTVEAMRVLAESV